MNAFCLAILLLCASTVLPGTRADSLSVSDKKLRQRAYVRVSSLPSRPAPIEKGAPAVLVAHPLRGAFVKRDFDSAAARLSAFLNMPAVTRSEFLAYLEGPSDSATTPRYCILPLDVATVRKERKTSVQNVVKLDKEGNFVPSSAGRDLSSTTVEMRVRFVVVDCRSKTIPWSARLTATASSDDFLMEEEAVTVAGPRPSRADQSYRCVMYIFETVKNKLSREFK